MDEIVDDVGDVVNDVRTCVLNVVVLSIVVLLLYCFKCRTPGRVAFVKSKINININKLQFWSYENLNISFF